MDSKSGDQLARTSKPLRRYHERTISTAPRVKVMPVDIARIDQPLAASRTGREKAKTKHGKISNLFVAVFRPHLKLPDERPKVVVGRTAAGGGARHPCRVMASLHTETPGSRAGSPYHCNVTRHQRVGCQATAYNRFALES